MKIVRRKLKKRNRAHNFDELETSFFGLVQKHNDLVKAHSILRQRFDQEVAGLKRQVNDIEPRYYC